jgi:hypothetical protein
MWNYGDAAAAAAAAAALARHSASIAAHRESIITTDGAIARTPVASISGARIAQGVHSRGSSAAACAKEDRPGEAAAAE